MFYVLLLSISKFIIINLCIYLDKKKLTFLKYINLYYKAAQDGKLDFIKQ